jgi:hypothetical protein
MHGRARIIYMAKPVIHIFVFSGPLILPGTLGTKDSKTSVNVGKGIVPEIDCG